MMNKQKLKMTQTFEQLWNNSFPKKIPIPHLLPHYFPEQWFRIHSLPDSKRYAETKEEYELLLKRHNQIITDCFHPQTSIFIVTGNYLYGNENDSKYDMRKTLPYSFITSPILNLHKSDPIIFDDGEDNDLNYVPLHFKTTWEPNFHDDLLLKIANDEVKAFLISFEKKIIVSPYDGGIDFIIQDESFKQQLKEKYSTWLSPREDGF